MSSNAPATGVRPPLSLRTKVLYGLGAASTGIKTRSFTAFLLIFYNQVMGLPPAMVSMAIMFATLYDSFVDPIVGQVSDNFRSRLGRRHPFMYAAAAPLSIAFLLIWNPPSGLTDGQLFAWLLTLLIIVRTFDTFFELPNAALGPELAPQYNERTKLISWRKAFETSAGLLMVLAGYRIFMPENKDGGGGIIDGAGYGLYGLTAAIIIFGVILASAAGTHGQIKYLKAPPARRLTIVTTFKEMVATLSNHAFMVMAVAGMIYMAAIGARAAMEVYFYLYFWDFSQGQIAILTLASVPGSLVGVMLAPVLVNWMGKKKAVLTVWFSSMVITLTPLLLRVLDILPGNESPIVFPVLLVETVLTQILLIAGAVLVPAMISDIVEDSEVKTGRRSEGLLFSADNLFRKFVSGIGVFVAGLVLTAVGFSSKAERGTVPESVLDHMAALYIPVYGGFILVAMAFVFMFRIDKDKHEENLRHLREVAAAAEMPPSEQDTGSDIPLPKATRPAEIIN